MPDRADSGNRSRVGDLERLIGNQHRIEGRVPGPGEGRREILYGCGIGGRDKGGSIVRFDEDDEFRRSGNPIGDDAIVHAEAEIGIAIEDGDIRIDLEGIHGRVRLAGKVQGIVVRNGSARPPGDGRGPQVDPARAPGPTERDGIGLLAHAGGRLGQGNGGVTQSNSQQHENDGGEEGGAHQAKGSDLHISSGTPRWS